MMNEILGGSVALLILKEVFAFVKLRKNGNGNLNQKVIEVLTDQTHLMQQQATILLDIKEVNRGNGDKLDNLTNKLSVAMERQVTLRDIQSVKGDA
jgi:hypothetical protein